MSYEEKYKEALKRADSLTEKYGGREFAEYVFPELKESEDERIREWLVDYFKSVGKSWIHRDISPERLLAYLEKQKEQKPVEIHNPTDAELQRHQDELYDFKVFAAKQAREHHISFVHDFEWNNFCAELLSYFNEQKPAEWSEELKNELAKKHLEGYIMGREDTMREMKDFLESHFNTQSGTSTLKAEDEK